MNKKAEGTIRYVVFVVLFVAMMGIINQVFDVESLRQEATNTEDSTFWTWIKSLFSGLDDIVEKIPIVGSFWSFANTSFQFVYIHPYLKIVLIAMIGIPFGYVVLRLIRGGG